MTQIIDLDPAAQLVKSLLGGVSDDQLAAATPCEHYTVADLLDHLMGLALAFRYAAAKAPVPTPPGVDEAEAQRPQGSAENLDPDWRDKLPVRLDELAAAWTDPAAWEGMAEAGGVTLPAEIMGRVAINELMLHGWDLARATGRPFEPDAASIEASHEFCAMMSVPGEEAGREGLFGPVVSVPAGASLLDRTLGFAGRDPGWSR